MTEKHDVFVGNVTFNTTEEQLQEIFSFVGPIKNIRILTDQNTGRPKGFAFIEYGDANTALAAIRHLDGHELNNRKLRVSYSNNSNLKEIARSIGQVIPDIYQSHVSTKQEYQAVSALQLHEAWDLLESMKKMVDDDRGRARSLLEAHPQLIGAFIEVQKRLGMIPALTTAPMAPGEVFGAPTVTAPATNPGTGSTTAAKENGTAVPGDSQQSTAAGGSGAAGGSSANQAAHNAFLENRGQGNDRAGGGGGDRRDGGGDRDRDRGQDRGGPGGDRGGAGGDRGGDRRDGPGYGARRFPPNRAQGQRGGYGYGDQDGRGGGNGGWDDEDQMQGHNGGRDDFEYNGQNDNRDGDMQNDRRQQQYPQQGRDDPQGGGQNRRGPRDQHNSNYNNNNNSSNNNNNNNNNNGQFRQKDY